jgi:hypothetical protein
MVLMVLLAAGLAFSPLPEEVSAASAWEVSLTETFHRTVAADVVRIGGLSLKFVQTRGICPEELRGDCEYDVHYEFRRLVKEGKMVAFVQRFVIVQPNGIREEGVGHLYWKAGRPVIDIFYRHGDRWLTEEPETEEYLTGWDYLMMLSERHSDREPRFGAFTPPAFTGADPR